MENRLPNPWELGNDFDQFCEENTSTEEQFFNQKATEIIDTISNENYIRVLKLAGIEGTEDEAMDKTIDALSSALFMAYACCGMEKTAEEYYKELML